MTTERETEIFTLLYALGDAIRIKDWQPALVIWERLVATFSPLAEWHPELGKVLHREMLLAQIAERQSSKLVH